jgi:hypothetical protein
VKESQELTSGEHGMEYEKIKNKKLQEAYSHRQSRLPW